MKKSIQGFFSRFRKKNKDPVAPRTSADSQLEDLEGMESPSEEEKIFSEKSFEKGQEALKKGFGTSTHSGDNPSR